MKKTFYQLLCVASDATSEVIEAAYERIRKQHANVPTAAQDDDWRIRGVALKEAYDTLKDPTRRALYNQRLSGELSYAAREPAPSGSRRLLWGALAVIVLVGAVGGMMSYTARKKAQEIEAARLAMEKAAVERRLALEEARQASYAERSERQEALLLEREARNQARREEAELARFRSHANSAASRAESAEARAEREAARKAEYEERQRQREEENARRAAKAKADAEKRELERLQRERLRNEGRVRY